MVGGGWEITSTFAARTGFPVNVLINRSATAVPDGNTTDQRPDLVPGVALTPPGGAHIGQWINPAAFSLPANRTFGNAPRDVARGPGAWQMDLGIDKRISFSEQARLEFRSEFFNIFNHPQYGLPQATFGVPGFGAIIQTVEHDYTGESSRSRDSARDSVCAEAGVLIGQGTLVELKAITAGKMRELAWVIRYLLDSLTPANEDIKIPGRPWRSDLGFLVQRKVAAA